MIKEIRHKADCFNMEDKKSFLLYCDIWHTVKKLPDDVAGKLIKQMLSYVNDEDPEEPEDLVLQVAWEPIKQQLKRDLKHWKDVREKRKLAGAQGGRPRKAKKANGLIEKQTKANESKKSCNSNSNSNNDKSIYIPKVSEVVEFFVENGYSQEAAEKAFEYYEEERKERNGKVWKDSKGNTVKSWKQKMRGVWFKPENKDQNQTTRKGLGYGY